MPTFTPPADNIVPNVIAKPHPMNRLYAHFAQNPRGRNVYKLSDGTYSETVVQDQGAAFTSPLGPGDFITGAPLPSVVTTYWGGTTTQITDAEASALLVAGYTTIAFDPRATPGLIAWWGADQLSLNNLDPVSSWPDALGYLPALTQSTSANQPSYRAGIINGRPVVRFDGVNDFLRITQMQQLAAPYTLLLVASSAATATQVFVAGATVVDVQSPGKLLVQAFSPDTASVTQYLSTSAVFASSAQVFVIAADQRYNLTVRRAGSSLAGSVTNVSIPDRNYDRALFPALTGGATSLLVGATSTGTLPLNGDIAELCLFERLLSTAEITALETDLATKYGI